MATTNPTPTHDRTTRTARVHQLAAQHLSHRAIARRLGIHHTTVGRILRTTPAPDAPAERTDDAPDAPAERTTPEPTEQAERTEDAPPAPMERTTTAPIEQAERTEDAPPAPTSGNGRAPRLLHPLDPRTIQDLNCLMDPRTGALPAPLVRAIHAAAEHRRTTMLATAHRIATQQ